MLAGTQWWFASCEFFEFFFWLVRFAAAIWRAPQQGSWVCSKYSGKEVWRILNLLFSKGSWSNMCSRPRQASEWLVCWQKIRVCQSIRCLSSKSRVKPGISGLAESIRLSRLFICFSIFPNIHIFFSERAGISGVTGSRLAWRQSRMKLQILDSTTKEACDPRRKPSDLLLPPQPSTSQVCLAEFQVDHS